MRLVQIADQGDRLRLRGQDAQGECQREQQQQGDRAARQPPAGGRASPQPRRESIHVAANESHQCIVHFLLSGPGREFLEGCPSAQGMPGSRWRREKSPGRRRVALPWPPGRRGSAPVLAQDSSVYGAEDAGDVRSSRTGAQPLGESGPVQGCAAAGLPVLRSRSA